MSELTADGYQTFKDYLNSSTATPPDWDYIEIYDDTGTAVTRVSITGDGRCSWGDVDGDNVLTVTFDVTGNDGDISLPVTLEQSAIWNDTSGNGGVQVTAKEGFASATLNQNGDNVTITHTLNIPQ
jgi:hypothetical protein